MSSQALYPALLSNHFPQSSFSYIVHLLQYGQQYPTVKTHAALLWGHNQFPLLF